MYVQIVEFELQGVGHAISASAASSATTRSSSTPSAGVGYRWHEP
jgi:hypothetical protein